MVKCNLMTTINDWYIFNGVKGVLADMNNEKFAGIKPEATNGECGFYSLSSIEGKGITDNDCVLEYYDSYEPTPVNIHEEIVSEQVVDIDNHQCLIDCFVSKELYEQDLYERMLRMETDSYYDWTSELTRVKDYAYNNRDRKDVKVLTEAKWNEVSKQYEGLAGDEEMIFEEVWNIIEQDL